MNAPPIGHITPEDAREALGRMQWMYKMPDGRHPAEVLRAFIDQNDG